VLDVESEFKALYKANVIGGGPNKISLGQVLVSPQFSISDSGAHIITSYDL
jgi:hypothetical protein